MIQFLLYGDNFQDGDTTYTDIGIGEVLNTEEAVDAIKDQFSLAWTSFKHIFTPQVFKGILGKQMEGGHLECLKQPILYC